RKPRVYRHAQYPCVAAVRCGVRLSEEPRQSPPRRWGVYIALQHDVLHCPALSARTPRHHLAPKAVFLDINPRCEHVPTGRHGADLVGLSSVIDALPPGRCATLLPGLSEDCVDKCSELQRIVFSLVKITSDISPRVPPGGRIQRVDEKPQVLGGAFFLNHPRAVLKHPCFV